MKVAIPDWQGRISPVFDVATRLVLADVGAGEVREPHAVTLTADGLQARVRQVCDQGVDVLICGAISRPLELAFSSAGVEVIAHRCGEVGSVLASFAAGRLGQEAFLMPGCCGRRRRLRGRAQRGPGPWDGALPSV